MHPFVWSVTTIPNSNKIYHWTPYIDTCFLSVAADALVAVGVSEQGLNLDFKLGKLANKSKKTN
jgi:hypothetical protein